MRAPRHLASAGGPDGRGARFLALGDSYTVGEGVSPEERWPSLLAAALRERGTEVEEPVLVARTGWTTDELSAGIDAAGPRGPFALVTLLIGVNDQYRGRSAEEYRGGFRALLERAVSLAGGRPGRVVTVSIPDWGVTPFAAGRDRARIGEEIDAFNAANREVSGELGTRWVDVTPPSRRAASGAGLLAPDGLHPSGRMYSAWVERILPEAAEALREP